MKSNLKKMLGLAALGITLLSNPVPIWAGLKNTREVFIYSNQGGTNVLGTMVGARYSADNTQYIGCKIFATFVSTGSAVTCSATDSTGTYVYCATSDPKFIEAVQSMTDSSYISFYTPQGSSRCSEIGIYDGSDMLK